MKHIPTEADLNKKLKLVEITVKGDYIARIDDKRTTSKPYEISVLVPENFTPSDVKRQTPVALKNSKEYSDFVYMRTHENTGAKPVKTDKTATRKELMSRREIVRIEKLRREAAQMAKQDKVKAYAGGRVIDTTPDEDLDERGLPPLKEPEYAGREG